MYKLKKFHEAKNCYTQAIEMCPESDQRNLAIFHQNRAAASDSMVPFHYHLMFYRHNYSSAFAYLSDISVGHLDRVIGQLWWRIVTRH